MVVPSLPDVASNGQTVAEGLCPWAPGPWVIAGPHKQRINYTVLTVGPASGWVCAVPTDAPRAEANAHLIASAPALYEALEPFARFLDALEQMGGTTPKTGVWHSVESATSGLREITVEDFKAARAALSKARGGQ